MLILDITKKNGTKCSRMCEYYKLYNSKLYMTTYTYKMPRDDEEIATTIRTTIKNVTDVKEVKTI